MDYKLVIEQINQGNFEKVYFLHGEEPYFIDAITDAIVEHALEEHERDFNQTVVYGKDTEVQSLISTLREYPMMSERRIVILKEAQDLKKIEELEGYMESPSDTTIFVINYKYKSYDSRKKIMKSAAQNGIVYKSDKIPEYKLEQWISGYVKEKGFGITPKASILLAEFLGNDISKIVNELDKLEILVEKGTVINDVHIEENIGISKDYNMYELVNAISERDIHKANVIVDYFAHNPKAGSIIPITANIYSHFERLMRIHFLDNKSKEVIASTLKVHPFVAGKLLNSAKIYKPKKIATNIAILHEYDLKAKGVGDSSSTDGQLMKEMIYRLMH